MAKLPKNLASIKLVVWDLDDTFWRGTLTEGKIELIPENVEIVKELTARGIVSSICSKNNFDDAKRILLDAGIWDLFVFPKIDFLPKAQAVGNIIMQANLRPQNTLFIDDNLINLREVEYSIPDIMLSVPEDILPNILKIAEAKGKDDRAHSRLKQYKILEQKIEDQENSPLSNEDFLRQSDIKVSFDYDIEGNFDRIVELINRSNQLNYTKKRLNNLEEIHKFRDDLNRYYIISGIVKCSDRYGDHGIIGFFMQLKNEKENKLIHFVFSCRMMNVGLEQFVYEHLGEPEIDVVEPVSNPIKVFETVPWITEGNSEETSGNPANDPQVLLIGSCDLTAVASYCSRNRTEYVNGIRDDIMVRYDDFGFILGDESAITQSNTLPLIPAWSKEDFLAFQGDLRAAGVVIVSLSAAIKGAHLVTDDGVVVRMHPAALGEHVDLNPGAKYVIKSKFYDISEDHLKYLLLASLQKIEYTAIIAGTFVVLGANTREEKCKISSRELNLRRIHNEVVKNFCDARPYWHYGSIDDIVSNDKLIDDRHFTRIGYYDIAEFVNEKIAMRVQESDFVIKNPERYPDFNVAEFVRSGVALNRLNLFGQSCGVTGQMKRLIKISPFERVARKIIGKV
jgi:FkbH-like protein